MEMQLLRLLPALCLALLLSCSNALAADTTQRLNINTANATEIADHLDGIGMAKAQAIIDYRDTHGPFRDLQSLGEVKGVGNKTLEKNADRLSFDTAENKSKPSPTTTKSKTN